ncbi:hypothetical protein DFAR_160002 [Desulfarculales bacterium]
MVFSAQEKLDPTLPGIYAEAPGAPVIGKITFDCLATPEFVQKLGELDRRTLLLCEVKSHICVAQTALSALKDYRVQVP